MAATFEVRPNEVDIECKLSGSGSFARALKITPTPDFSQWSNPPGVTANPKPVQEGGGQPSLTIEIEIDDLLLQVRENLLTRLLEAITRSVQALGTASAGDIRPAIEAIANAVRAIVTETRRRLDLAYGYNVEVMPQGLHLLLAEHAHTFQNSVSQTFGTVKPKTNSEIFSRLRVGSGQGDLDLYFRRRSRTGKSKKPPNVDYVQSVKVAFGTVQLAGDTGVEVFFEGFREELDIDRVLDELKKLLEAIVDLSVGIFETARVLLKTLGKKLGFDVGDVGTLDADALLNKLKEVAMKMMNGFVALFTVLINEFTESIRLDRNTITLTCITQAGFDRFNEVKVGGGEQEEEGSEEELEAEPEIIEPPPVALPPIFVEPGVIEEPTESPDVPGRPTIFRGSELLPVPYDILRRTRTRLFTETEDALADELSAFIEGR